MGAGVGGQAERGDAVKGAGVAVLGGGCGEALVGGPDEHVGGERDGDVEVGFWHRASWLSAKDSGERRLAQEV